MNEHDAFEQAYKNGYEKGRIDVAKEICYDLNLVFSKFSETKLRIFPMTSMERIISTLEYIRTKYVYEPQKEIH